jgi:hypothetical protein
MCPLPELAKILGTNRATGSVQLSYQISTHGQPLSIRTAGLEDVHVASVPRTTRRKIPCARFILRLRTLVTRGEKSLSYCRARTTAALAVEQLSSTRNWLLPSKTRSGLSTSEITPTAALESWTQGTSADDETSAAQVPEADKSMEMFVLSGNKHGGPDRRNLTRLQKINARLRSRKGTIPDRVYTIPLCLRCPLNEFKKCQDIGM